MIHLLLAVIYLSFISLGLPDSLLGSAWPSMCLDFAVPVSYAGIISLIISLGTVVSSLLSDRMTRWFGAGKVTAVSVAMTALALFGFSVSGSYWLLLLWAVPYGLGAGSVDAALNNYVALHYASRHMSWLHCMWGVGASIGPYIMGYALTGGQGWQMGYRYISLMQIVLTALLLISLPLWKKTHTNETGENGVQNRVLSLREIVAIPGAKEIMVAFFCYCAVEQTTGLWASTYLVRQMGLGEEEAASLASLFFIGITLGRAVSGFVTMKINDVNMIRLGQGIVVAGIAVMLLPLGTIGAMVGLILIGLGCAPIYPCVIHSTPDHFGPDRSQAIIGVQMAAAYTGVLVMPPVFGLIARYLSSALLPGYLAVITALMIIMCERLNRLQEKTCASV
ncbi:MAG: MFS transporter [Oscillospiraceae bacterium]|nr:MFS transporter [Oscillospiraceae bacterium]